MKDVFSKTKRSEVMSKIRGKENKSTELLLMKIMRINKIKGWRRNSNIFGKPDFIFPNSRVALFIDGCFWHGCSKHVNVPRNNRKFWVTKLNSNKVRDKLVNRRLKKLNWSVLRLWEHELSNGHRVARKINAMLARPEVETE